MRPQCGSWTVAREAIDVPSCNYAHTLDNWNYVLATDVAKIFVKLPQRGFEVGTPGL